MPPKQVINDGLCVVCNKNKQARRNMCTKCGKLEKFKEMENNNIYYCINIKICKNQTDEKNKECDSCLEYPKQFLLEENFSKKSIMKSQDILCEYVNCYCCGDSPKCQFKQIIGTKYCKNCYILSERLKIGIRSCSNIKRCKNILQQSDAHIRCEKCRNDDSEGSKNRRINAKEKNEKKVDDTKNCTNCCKEMNLSNFLSDDQKKLYDTCINCRLLGRIADKKRPEHWKEYYLKNPEQYRQTKKEWKEMNKDKIIKYCKSYRYKQFLENPQKYHEKNKLSMAKYRMEHAEMFMKIYIKNKIDEKYKLRCYKNRANKNNIGIYLSDEEFTEMFFMDCFYCGRSAITDVEKIDENSGLNGIDRLDNNESYSKDNCVPCCKTCNYIKLAFDYVSFFNMCEHILTYQKVIDGKFYYDSFCNYGELKKFNNYKKSAEKRNKCFELNCSEFNEITLNSCYICGKKNNEYHKNGIDRYDNEIGYIYDNCKACCANCNYMKKNLSFDYFINHLKKIYYFSIFEKEIENLNIPSNNIFNEIADDQFEEDALDLLNLKRIMKNEKFVRKIINEDMYNEYIPIRKQHLILKGCN